ncbi:hypothetical protein DFH08DRAFT_820238 [Mycena albidolilacea]|uniref:Uncharacterized protein n=1 Tax=Mycena albidolilacea TaxID=1033008 RepID=A0AAD7EFP6_9AGAR|nr:hypothetical protein DFH08DRAFT_820238 [Mycena albidolilacea]
MYTGCHRIKTTVVVMAEAEKRTRHAARGARRCKKLAKSNAQWEKDAREEECIQIKTGRAREEEWRPSRRRQGWGRRGHRRDGRRRARVQASRQSMHLKRWGVGRKVDRERTAGGETPRRTCKQRRTQLEGQGRGEGGREECFLTIFPTDKRGNFIRMHCDESVCVGELIRANGIQKFKGAGLGVQAKHALEPMGCREEGRQRKDGRWGERRGAEVYMQATPYAAGGTGEGGGREGGVLLDNIPNGQKRQFYALRRDVCVCGGINTSKRNSERAPGMRYGGARSVADKGQDSGESQPCMLFGTGDGTGESKGLGLYDGDIAQTERSAGKGSDYRTKAFCSRWIVWRKLVLHDECIVQHQRVSLDPHSHLLSSALPPLRVFSLSSLELLFCAAPSLRKISTINLLAANSVRCFRRAVLFNLLASQRGCLREGAGVGMAVCVATELSAHDEGVHHLRLQQDPPPYQK